MGAEMRHARAVVALVCVGLWRASVAFFVLNEEGIRVELAVWQNAWVVTLPRSMHGDVLVPQTCVGVCTTRHVAEIMSCGKAWEFLRQQGWGSENWAGAGFQCPSVVGTWDDNLLSLQLYLGEPSPGVMATPPHSFRVAVNVSMSVVRYTYLTRVGEKLSVISAAVALPGNQTQITAIAVGVQHECARRGLQAPPRAILYLSPDAAGACLWKCRHGYVRSPWNSPPPLAGVLTDARVCRALPSEFTAAEFDLLVGLAYTTPSSLQLDMEFFESLDLVGTWLENEALERGMQQAVVALTVPGSVFHDVSFGWVIEQHVFARANELTYEVLVNQNSLSRRRLLSADLLTVSGVIFTSSISISPTRFVETVEGLNASGTGPITSVGVPIVTKLHHGTALPGGGGSGSGVGGEGGSDPALALGGVALAAASIGVICVGPLRGNI